MKAKLKCFLISTTFFCYKSLALDVSVIKVSGPINLGVGQYVNEGIIEAEKRREPFVLIELNSYGGLPNVIKSIVQQILNSSIPVVTYITPKGATACGGAEWLSFASDVAFMTPGTSLGTISQVPYASKKIDPELTILLEGIAKTKERNPEAILNIVRGKAILTASQALNLKVIDLIASSEEDALSKISDFKLKGLKSVNKPFNNIKASNVLIVQMTFWQKFLSFISDPTLSYCFLVFGGICLFFKFTHSKSPTVGIIGSISIVIALLILQVLPVNYGALVLALIGIALVLSELLLPSFGLLALSGLTTFIVGSFYLIEQDAQKFQLPLSVVLATAATLAGSAFIIGSLCVKPKSNR